MAKSKQETELKNTRGVADITEAKKWLQAQGIEDIECIVPDQAGVARGKMMPIEKFFSGPVMTMPSSIFCQTISGEYPAENNNFKHKPTDGDLFFHADFATLCRVPWESEPTAQLIHDVVSKEGSPIEVAPRNVLKRVVELYRKKGWQPVVAPEIEFYLVKPNTDPDIPLEPPLGRSGRPEIGRQSYSITALNEFDDIIDDIYNFSEAQGLEIDTLIHEEGAAQMEINLRHGNPLELADQVFLFKRTIREAAHRHETYATFMAKPMSNEPASALHIHQSILDIESGKNLFSTKKGDPSKKFFGFIAGQQKYLPSVTCVMAPYVNSYRRFSHRSVSPINVFWGYDNRTVGLRIPNSDAEGRRIENRLPSSDANPYLAIAASLACGYLGMVYNLKPDEPRDNNCGSEESGLPRNLLDAIELFANCEDLFPILGEKFVHTFNAIKSEEYETFMSVISAWEREYLLLNV